MTEFKIPPGTTTKPKPLSQTGSDEIVAQSAKQQAEQEKEINSSYKDENQLNEFWNCIIKKVPYKKEFNIKGLKVILRTRSTKEVNILMKYMDQYNASLISTHDYIYSKALLALSLVQLGEEFIDSGTFEEKMNYLDNLPDVTLRLVMRSAAIFEKEIGEMEDAIYSPNF